MKLLCWEKSIHGS
uniref:Early nodulin-40-1 n=1 Tax=Medicago truncatula TaxID=3880 RepID=NO40A_MEDTR|nr:RecName: Full=Early nodulin-40-1; Short=Mtenod4O [Medicago truncatula]